MGGAGPSVSKQSLAPNYFAGELLTHSSEADLLWQFSAEAYAGPEMNDLPPEVLHHLRAAEGWLELGDHLSANEELDQLPSSLSDHPQVLMLRWQVYARACHWESAYEIANTLVKLAPDEPTGWIHRSYVLHEQRRTQEAWDQLLPAWERFPIEPTIAYNLACYACQLGRLKEAWTWLERAFAMDDSQTRILKREALEDPDLAPLRNKLAKL